MAAYCLKHLQPYYNCPFLIICCSQGMGHEDVRTTEIYLDSFEQDVLDDFNEMITE